MNHRILVVDDEPDIELLIRQRYKNQVRNKELDFVFAGNGVQALERLRDFPDVSLILTDINMPEMDGLTFLTRLNELNRPECISVIVSAYGDMTNIRTAMNRGAFDFLIKPFDFEDLDATIFKTLRHINFIQGAIASQKKLSLVERDLSIAADIQLSMLPRTFPPFPERPEVEIFARILPAREVGGDFYDFYFIDADRLAFVIGDVSGKGIPAALYMTVSKALLKNIACQVINPGECLRKLNNALLAERRQAMFVTLFFGVLNTKTGALHYSNGGHPSPYLLRPDGLPEPLPAVGGPIVGMLDDNEYDTGKFMLRKGDALLLYTDGVTEARDAGGRMFEESRLRESLTFSGQTPLENMVSGIISDVERFAGGEPQSDDLTILTIKYAKT
jgi:sigma-B regulation protein RsbU (phosphoserine phosphatase)